jgi:hypothetical protein
MPDQEFGHYGLVQFNVANFDHAKLSVNPGAQISVPFPYRGLPSH